MRKWHLTEGSGVDVGQALAGMISRLGQPHFEEALLNCLHPLVPAGSWSVYRTGRNCQPAMFMSASHGMPDTTRDCWRAYLSGPYLSDRTLVQDGAAASPQPATLLCHITAQEVASEHRARVYDAHGVAERVSIVRQQDDESVFAINFYRHTHQRAFSDGQVAAFEGLAPALLALTQKHLALADSLPPVIEADSGSVAVLMQRLRRLNGQLTARELDVCARLLQGMTQAGVAADLGLSLPTVKTYRNRAFARLGIHFRNELFGLLLKAPQLH
ncbi:LuxR C-terminal-related transcriptional regulator [Polaromonas sp. UC242_47]|uniref:helix-turn-helix transcriptional regulator n=1 Tax=Polaromonas sp. UC242_47 TaxID=3374626 RepID=UPI0037926CD5